MNSNIRTCKTHLIKDCLRLLVKEILLPDRLTVSQSSLSFFEDFLFALGGRRDVSIEPTELLWSLSETFCCMEWDKLSMDCLRLPITPRLRLVVEPCRDIFPSESLSDLEDFRKRLNLVPPSKSSSLLIEPLFLASSLNSVFDIFFIEPYSHFRLDKTLQKATFLKEENFTKKGLNA